MNAEVRLETHATTEIYCKNGILGKSKTELQTQVQDSDYRRPLHEKCATRAQEYGPLLRAHTLTMRRAFGTCPLQGKFLP